MGSFHREGCPRFCGAADPVEPGHKPRAWLRWQETGVSPGPEVASVSKISEIPEEASFTVDAGPGRMRKAPRGPGTRRVQWLVPRSAVPRRRQRWQLRVVRTAGPMVAPPPPLLALELSLPHTQPQTQHN